MLQLIKYMSTTKFSSNYSRIPNLLIFVLVTGLFIFSCKDENEILTDEQLGLNYFPLEIGMTKIYKVDSVLYQKSNNIFRDTTHSFLMEVVADSIQINNDMGFRIDVFSRRSENDNWELVDNRFEFKNKLNVTIQDKGLNYIKMIFPVLKNKSWNGNIQIDQSNEIKVNGEFFQPFKYWNGRSYYYKDIQKDLKVGEINYEKVVTVEEVDYTDDINRIFSIHQYAENKGLVYKEFWILTTENTDPSLPWADKALYGVILKQTLIQ